jgi:hypothetical protein
VNEDVHLKKLQMSLKAHLQMMQQTAQAVIDQDISNYPIFLSNETTPALGISILTFDFEGKKMVMNITTLEELATKGVVNMEKVNDFKTVYQQNDHSFCLLILEAAAAKFIFIPKEDN